MVYSTSLAGFRNAVRALDLAAAKIASPRLREQMAPEEVSADAAGRISSFAPSGPSVTVYSADYVVELLNVDQAKTLAKANLKALSSQAELEKETLDLLG